MRAEASRRLCSRAKRSMTKLRFRRHNVELFNTFCRPTRLKGERCAPRHWNQYRMLPWRFFRPYLGIFASIDADGAAFAAEMRRNSDGRSLGWMSESRAARLAVAPDGA